MKTRTSLLIFYLASAALVSGNAFAQDTLNEKDDSPLIPEAFISEPIYSDIELGIGYVADDAYFFGRYNGLQSEGAYLVGDIDARRFSDDGGFWNVRGTNLGLESRYLRMEGGKQGRYKFFLEWDELPNYMNNTGQTPFDGVGTDNLTLPSGYTGTGDLDTYLHGFELQTKRERIKTGASFVAKQRWLFDIDFSHENKQGVDAIGGAIYNGTSNVVRNTNTSLLPEPIDQDTDLVNATLTYAGEDGQVDLTYHASFFNNTYASLSWQDPFNPATGEGSMAMAPDNEFHQLSLTAGYSLPYRSRLTGVASMGRMTQNQKFQPYSVNSGIPASESLDGEVWVLNGQLKLSSRPITKLRLNADLVYDERDNQTPVETYSYIVLDSINAGGGVDNNPYSYKKTRFNLEANYRFNAIVSLRGGYKYTGMTRSDFDAGREDTDENTLFAKVKVKPHSTIDLELYGEAGSRDGSEFEQPGYQDPLMRKYNLADRDRTKMGALINYMATEKLYLGARADYSEDDYTDTQIGLTEASQPTVTVDFSYTPVDNLTTYGYYTWENIQSSQNGEDLSALGGGGGTAVPTTGPWQADFDDTFDTVGVGAKWTDLGKWDLGADFIYSKAVGHIEINHQDPNVPEDQFPDNLTEMYSIKLWTDYNYSKRLVYKFGYWYEEYLADNWAVDGLEPYDPTAVANTLLLGDTTMDYEVRVFMVSASYKFQ
jgi:MtrB/PioB family decaheme-associated outer membrane protein